MKVTLSESRADDWEEDGIIEKSMSDLMWDPVKVFIKFQRFAFKYRNTLIENKLFQGTSLLEGGGG